MIFYVWADGQPTGGKAALVLKGDFFHILFIRKNAEFSRIPGIIGKLSTEYSFHADNARAS